MAATERYTWLMSTQAEMQLLTAEEFFHLPEPPHGGKLELVLGRVVEHMPVSGKHGVRASRINRAIGYFVEQHSLGECMVETGYILRRNPDLVRAPDVSFLAAEQTPEGGIPEEGFLQAVPTLAVEVVSPGDLDADVQDKVIDYLTAGAERVWVVRPKSRSVTVYHGDSARILTGAAVLSSDDAGFSAPGFELKLEDLFA